MSFNKDIFSVEFPQYFTWFNAIEKGNFYIKISVAYIEKYIQSIFTDSFIQSVFKLSFNSGIMSTDSFRLSM